jgi:hypothetical protein
MTEIHALVSATVARCYHCQILVATRFNGAKAQYADAQLNLLVSEAVRRRILIKPSQFFSLRLAGEKGDAVLAFRNGECNAENPDGMATGECAGFSVEPFADR